MLVHIILISLGMAYITEFTGTWLTIDVRTFRVTRNPLHFHEWCKLGLGTCYACAGAVGA